MEESDNLLYFTVGVNIIFSLIASFATYTAIPNFIPLFLRANLKGRDVHKRHQPILPEAIGVVSGTVYLITMFVFIPIPFYLSNVSLGFFSYKLFVEFLAGILSICCMLFLGFADDVLDLKWRHRISLPLISSLPLLVIYMVNINSTIIAVPWPLIRYFGSYIDIHFFYYIYMASLSIFCTNSVNILAGINGLEIGQSVVICMSIMLFNLCEMFNEHWRRHLFSLYFLIPYIFTTIPLLYYNAFPAKVLVGDTFCYYSGMTIAMIAILGHFTKTVMLFFIPQIFNFVFSLPQLLRIVPCPRHRMPSYLLRSDALVPSFTTCKKSSLSALASQTLRALHATSLISLREYREDQVVYVKFSNLTFLCLLLKTLGPLPEKSLTRIIVIIQICLSVFAFFIRYPVGNYFYHF